MTAQTPGMAIAPAAFAPIETRAPNDLAAAFIAHPEAAQIAGLVDAVSADLATVYAARGARVRNIVNRSGMLVDAIPWIADPSTILELTSLAAKGLDAIPQERRDRMGVVGRIVTKLTRLDPVPDIPASTLLKHFAVEAGTFVIPSWYLTAKPQIRLDTERLRDARAARRRLRAAHQSGALAFADAWRPHVEAHRSLMAVGESA